MAVGDTGRLGIPEQLRRDRTSPGITDRFPCSTSARRRLKHFAVFVTWSSCETLVHDPSLSLMVRRVLLSVVAVVALGSCGATGGSERVTSAVAAAAPLTTVETTAPPDSAATSPTTATLASTSTVPP